ncbi:restriction endonuclease subunit S [Clostridium sp. JS66]|uniref:restriction endonuclease subunit S n=1 Tax=Clostridium sp. JS66 TaxID=3064705 RepID=UPI0039998D91
MVAKVDELFSLIDELDNNKQDLLQNIADSKNKILQLAIQGKLAEQNEEDEPASVLLDKIAEEKERLIKEKKIKKEKSLPEIKEEEKYFELSKGWEWCRFGNIGCFQKGYAFKSKDYVGDGVKITKVSNLNNPFNKDVVYIDKKDALKYEQYKLYKDDIVLTTVGSWPTAPASVVGNVIYIDEIFDNTLLNQNAVRIRSKLNQKYLNIILKSKLFKRYIVDIAQGTANQASITQEDIKLFLLPIPPIAEQFRIVEKVNMLMAYLDELEKTILGQDVI